MLLHSLNDATAIQHPTRGLIQADNGVFRVDEELGAELLAINVNGAPIFETDTAHIGRLAEAELARRRDPAALYDLLEGKGKPASEDDGIDQDALAKTRAADSAKLQADADAAAKAEEERLAALAKEAPVTGSSETQTPPENPVVDPADPKAAEKVAAIEAKDYTNSVLLVADLQALCASRDLDPKGQRADLVARLQQQDAGAASQK